MNELIEKYNGKFLSLIILDNKYNAQFYFEDNQLKVRLLDFVDRTTALNLKKGFKLVNGIMDKKELTIFNFQCCGSCSGMDSMFELRFRFDEFVENLNFKNVSNKKIKAVSVEFYNINDFTTIPYYEYDKNLNPIFRCKSYNYEFEKKRIIISVGGSITSGHSIYRNDKKIYVNFKYNKSQKYVDVLRDVYHFKAFLSILSKREIGIKKIRLNDDSLLFLNCIKFEDKLPTNEFLAHHYNDFVLTIEKLDEDFENIYVKFNELLDDALPIFDIYLDVLNYPTSKLNKFLNYTQILEYISKNYDSENAVDVWIKNGKPGRGVTLSDRIESILNQVSYIWDFTKKRTYKISRKIANGRNYYNHHTDESKKLSNDELFFLSYFLEDLVLAYIYQYIGVDKKIIKESLNYNIYYDKRSLMCL